jgi:hypothetical protein
VTTTTDVRIQFSDSEVTSPRARTVARRAVFWIVIALILVILALVTFVTTGVSTSTARLSATNPGPTGAEALINVLREDGVTVHAPRSLASATREATAFAGSTTLVVYDPTSILSEPQLASLQTIATNVVLILPTSHALDALAPGVNFAGVVPDTAKADCNYRPVRRAGAVAGLEQGYRIDTATRDEQGCLGSGAVYSLVRVNSGSQTVTVLGSTTMLTNQSIPLAGNAALALGLFGSTTHLIWYRPSFEDTPGIAQDGILPNPPWVILAIILAGLVLIAAGVWRGRRLGPVVVERLPITVRASETLEGRARLYQRASARLHALDALRIGAISRMAIYCGLPTIATLDEVIGAVAAITGRSTASLRQLLLDEVPTSDSRLVRLSDALNDLELEVQDAVVPA